jgi:hypothetical protein
VGHYLGLFKLLRLADRDYEQILEHNPQRLFGFAPAS